MANERAGEKRRHAALAAVHIARKELGLDDATYRAMLQRDFDARSAAELDGGRLGLLLEQFRKLGWKGAQAAGDGSRTKSPGDPQAAKIRALWGELERRGLLRDASVRALRAFVRRMTRVDDARFLDARQANVVIEALKGWLQRGEREGDAGTDQVR